VYNFIGYHRSNEPAGDFNRPAVFFINPFANTADEATMPQVQTGVEAFWLNG
jgi:hypothetical protein